ncbi:MAG: hypothetical protein R3330_07755, partial [Saprospiraceae bacterium]|nr:hypothetical protein [Saprospiraceae bacterium]
FPEDEVVMVNRANTFIGEQVNGDDLRRLTEMLWAARTGQPEDHPTTVPLSIRPSLLPRTAVSMTRRQLEQYTGQYTMREAVVTVKWHGRKLQIDTPFAGAFDLIPVGEDIFLAEDAWYVLQFIRNGDGRLSSTINMIR